MSTVLSRARDLARGAAPDAPVVATIRVPSPPRRIGAPLVVWEPAEGPSFSAWGEAARVDASGVERFERVRDAGAAILDEVIEVRADDARDAPPPRLFGGFAFREGGARVEPWAAFGDASFALPRVRFATEAGVTWLSMATPAREARHAGALERAVADALALAESAPEPASASPNRVEWPSAGAWSDTVNAALAGIEAEAFRKVVTATVCHVDGRGAASPARALERLRLAYPTSTRFAFERDGAVFLGASPETLVSLSAGVARADALAGTIARGADDEAARAALFGSDKDRREHEAVVAAIRAALGPLALGLSAAGEPGFRTLRNVLHLCTPIEARLRDRAHVLDLVARLHPTPAVAGAPREAALAWLADRERLARGWYAGAVGWFDRRGEGVFQVGIRAGVLAGSRAWLFAGAGIVAGSTPAAEYAEVRAKLAPMLDALEASP